MLSICPLGAYLLKANDWGEPTLVVVEGLSFDRHVTKNIQIKHGKFTNMCTKHFVHIAPRALISLCTWCLMLQASDNVPENDKQK